MKASAQSSEGASLWEEQACLDCLITKNPPEVGLERAGRFIHHILSEYRGELYKSRPVTASHARKTLFSPLSDA